MSAAIIPLRRPPATVTETLPTPVEGVGVSIRSREAAAARMVLIAPAIARVQSGVSIRNAATWLLTQMPDGMLPSEATLQRWIKAGLDGDLGALVPSYKGRVRGTYGWEARALQLYARPQGAYYATVALWLRQEGHDTATESRVRRYLKNAPSNLTQTAPARVGQHYYRQNIRPHVIRDSTVIPVGLIYEGDGHTCDVYVAHPATGKHYRPELTIWIDVRSQYVVGWWLSESESAHTTLFSLSSALTAHDHVPAFLHTDPGSGFRNKLINDQDTGWLRRFSIEVMLALPGNAKGKGLTEGWFRWFEERLGKQFDTFCGHCRTDDALSRLQTRIARGELRLVSFADYTQAVRDFITSYNTLPKETLGGKAPADLWAGLDRVPLEMPEAAVVRPRELRSVRRWGITLHGRLYRAAELAAFEQRDVLVEYSVVDDRLVWIYDAAGNWVCDARLVEKKHWLPESRIEEAQQRRLQGQQQRLQRRLDEVQARARAPIDITPLQPDAIEVAQALAELNAPEPESPAEEGEEQRFARYLLLRYRTDLDADQQRWLDAYAQSAECLGLLDIYESFGSMPTPNAKGPAPTEPFVATDVTQPTEEL